MSAIWDNRALDKTGFTVTEAAVLTAVNGCCSAEHRQIAWDIAADGLTLLKNQNSPFPMEDGEGEEALILFTAASRAGTGPLFETPLREMDTLPAGAAITSTVSRPDTAEDASMRPEPRTLCSSSVARGRRIVSIPQPRTVIPWAWSIKSSMNCMPATGSVTGING